MLHYDRTDIREWIDLATSNNKKNGWFGTIGFLIMDSTFKIMLSWFGNDKC